MEEAREKKSTNAPRNGHVQKTQRERQVLLLARARVLKQLESSPNERYSESRRRALKELEEKIKRTQG